jgi:hypothetical protein
MIQMGLALLDQNMGFIIYYSNSLAFRINWLENCKNYTGKIEGRGKINITG